MTRQERHRQKRRQKGLCGREGCPEQSGAKYYCFNHARGEAARMKKTREAQKEAS